MDALPTDLVIHILSFLPGKDVLRFKRLNSHFQWIVEKKRCSLQYPKFTMYISHVMNEYWEEKEIIEVLLYGLTHCKEHHGPVKCEVNFKDPHGVKVTINRKYYRKWFPPLVFHHCSYKCNIFYPLLWGKTSLRSFFDFILRKGDIEIKMCSGMNPVIFHALAESVKYSSSQIKTLKMYGSSFKAGSDLAIAVACHKRRNRKYPRLELQCFSHALYRYWSDLKKFNEIAPKFTKARLQFADDDMDKVTRAINEHWRIDPFPCINFALRIGRLNCFNESPWNGGEEYAIILDESKGELRFPLNNSENENPVV